VLVLVLVLVLAVRILYRAVTKAILVVVINGGQDSI
jgi:hypothetical protein